MEELQLERCLFQGYFVVKAYYQDYLSNNYKFRTPVLFFFLYHLNYLFFKNVPRVSLCILLENS